MNSYSYDKVFNREVLTVDHKGEVERCNCNIIHEDIVREAKQNMPAEENLFELAELFKVFGDTTRVKILYALFSSEMCVCDIAALLGMTQSAISHQLRILKQSRLVKYRKDGKIVYYALNDDHIKQIFDQGLSHVNE
ncbi:MAG: metalloregulator ArsR/SmtB family transcription factor [Clostridia bacterium]|nr:metalloregulator ArsR/SmtB family transcription factor [Clostridia bacterium]